MLLFGMSLGNCRYTAVPHAVWGELTGFFAFATSLRMGSGKLQFYSLDSLLGCILLSKSDKLIAGHLRYCPSAF